MILGISGKMRCGKSVLAKHLENECSLCYTFNFGDLLKEEASTIFHFPLKWCYTKKGKSTVIEKELGVKRAEFPKYGMTVREVLQWYGTDVIRKKDPDHWVVLMDKVILRAIKLGVENILIADVRFPNEADWINSRRGKVVRLNPYLGYQWDPTQDHESETALDDYDNFWISISPPFGKLKETAKYIMEIL